MMTLQPQLLTTLMVHLCTFQQAGSVTSYGHTTPSWTSGTSTLAADVACMLQPKEHREQATGAIISSHTLYLPYASAPTALTAYGAEGSVRVLNWQTSAGVLLDAGPFDIIKIADPAGLQQLLQIQLLRVG